MLHSEPSPHHNICSLNVNFILESLPASYFSLQNKILIIFWNLFVVILTQKFKKVFLK